jgi:hypothetical protein
MEAKCALILGRSERLKKETLHTFTQTKLNLPEQAQPLFTYSPSTVALFLVAHLFSYLIM